MRADVERPPPTAVDKFLLGIFKLFGAGILLVIFVGIGAAAGLEVSGWECSGGGGGGMSFSGCGSERGTLGWMVFAECVGIGVALAGLTIIPATWRRQLFHAPGAPWRLTLIALAVLLLPLLIVSDKV